MLATEEVTLGLLTNEKEGNEDRLRFSKQMKE